MTTLTLSDYAHELLAFQPDDFHWPTAFVTALSLIIFYFTNKLIARAVSSTTAVPPHQPASAASPAASTTFDASKLLDFYLLVGRLKTTKRTGWVDHNVPLPESISDHMYRLTLILYTLLPNTATTDRIASSTSNTYLPQQQALLMSLTHDLAECIAGDITPTEYSGVTKESKHKLEADAMQHILTHLPAAQRTQVHSLWRDYEEDGGAISRLLHDCDKLEMVVQAFEYERAEHRRRRGETSVSGAGGDKGRPSSDVGVGSGQKALDRFYESVKKIRDERVKRIAQEVMRRRRAELFDSPGAGDVGGGS